MTPTLRRPLLLALLVLLVASIAGAQEPSGGRYDFASLIEQRGLAWALLVAFGTGVLVSFTPCVYPMIPITVGIIGARSEATTLRRSFGLSFTYVFGLVVVYSVLGLLVGLLGAQVRGFVMSPYVLIGVAVIFGVLALGMFGLYELQLPPSLLTRINAIGGRGFVGVLLMGMVSGLVASPCTAAPLAGILTFVAVQGSPVTGFLLLFAFAWGMGLLLLVVGTSAGALTHLPKSGDWMLDVKRLFGFLFLAVATYFVKTFIPEVVYYLAIAGCLIGGGVAFGAFDSLTTPTTGGRIKKAVGVLLMVLGFYLLLGTLWNKGLLIPERSAAIPTVVAPGAAPVEAPAPLNWNTDFEASLATACQENKRVLMEWTADWCTICEEMEKEAFSRPDVREALSRYVLVRVDATELEGKEKELAEEYEFLAPPTLIVADGDGTIVGKLEGYESPESLLAFLEDPEGAGTEEVPGST